MSIDFDKIKRDYPLPGIVRDSGVPVTQDGDEWRACCPFHGEKTPSFTIYNGKQGWKYWCFGCGANGDVFDFVEERYGLKTKGEAASQITGDGQRPPMPIREEHEARSNPYAGYEIIRPPDTAPRLFAGSRTPPLLNPKRLTVDGAPKAVTYKPTMVFPYEDKHGALLGYVLRVEIDGRKLTPAIWWTRNDAARYEGWSHGSFPAPRPLYNLPAIYADPNHQVLLVEGEKCGDAGKRVMADLPVTVTTWMGGTQSISQVHWKSLAGRSVLIWPDNDDPGYNAVFGHASNDGAWHKGIIEYLLEAGVARIKVLMIDRAARPSGWDIADAENEIGAQAIHMLLKVNTEEWTKARFDAWKRDQLDSHRPQSAAPAQPEETVIEQPKRPTTEVQPAEVETFKYAIDDANWREHLIMKADGTGLKGNSLQNFALLLQYEQRFAGIFAWNDFAKEVYLMRRPPWDISGNLARWTPRVVNDPDVTSAACWLEYCGMSPKTNDVGKIIQRVAQHNSYNPVTDALDRMQWDGAPRLMGGQHGKQLIMPWLARYLGADNTPINAVFGAKWLVSAVARAYQPGCKVDTMLILEGPQGIKKSTSFRVLADAIATGIFTDEVADVGSKDAGLQMQGMLLVEISELDAMRKAEVSTLKAWLTRQNDRFRRPYGKIVENFPRTSIFCGSVNPSESGYLKDPTGARRFWPVKCGEIDLQLLQADATQLWAEAIQLYRQGFEWWLDADEARAAGAVQEARYEHDPWSLMIANILRDDYPTHVTPLTIMQKLEIPMERRTNIVYARIVAHLRKIGWISETDETGELIFKNPDRIV